MDLIWILIAMPVLAGIYSIYIIIKNRKEAEIEAMHRHRPH